MEFDGRGLAVGIAAGVVIGLIVMYLTGNQAVIPIFAAIGAVLGLNTGWFNRGDKQDTPDRR